MKSLKGKVAIVTGGGSGLGEATVRLFLNHGAKVVFSDINQSGIDSLLSKLSHEKKSVHGIMSDSSKRDDLKNLFNESIEKFGTVDIIVNNAGILDNLVSLDELDFELWDKVMSINIKGPAMLSQIGIRFWLKNKQPGVIINMASIAGMFGARGGVSYSCSKHAVIGLTKSIASMYREDNIRCVAVAPGSILTNIGKTINNPDQRGMRAMSEYVSSMPEGDPNDIANTVVFLSSDEANFINGTVITVDGGATGA